MTDDMIAAVHTLGTLGQVPFIPYGQKAMPITKYATATVELIGDGERIWRTRALIAEGRVAELEGELAAVQSLARNLKAWNSHGKSLFDKINARNETELDQMRAELTEARIRIGQRDASVLRAVKIG